MEDLLTGLRTVARQLWPRQVTFAGETVSFSDLITAALLVTCAFMSLLIYFIRTRQRIRESPLWAVMSFGLFFLAEDEFFSFHETFDLWVHDLAGMTATAWTTQVDSLV